MSLASNHSHEDEPQGVIRPDATEYGAEAAPEPATRLERRTLELLTESHGDAFRAYLDNVWDGTPIDEIENEFTNLYWASFPDRKAFIDSVIDGLGWKDGYDDLVARTAMPSEILNWNYPLLLDRLQESYEVLDLGGKIHVFFK